MVGRLQLVYRKTGTIKGCCPIEARILLLHFALFLIRKQSQFCFHIKPLARST